MLLFNLHNSLTMFGVWQLMAFVGLMEGLQPPFLLYINTNGTPSTHYLLTNFCRLISTISHI